MDASEQSKTSEVESAPLRAPFLSTLIATGCYTGYIPWASGTFGSLVAVFAYLVPGMEAPQILIPLITIGMAAGVITSSSVANAVGHRLTASAARAKAIFQQGTHSAADPSIIVIDEIVGMWISLLFLPKSWTALAIAFIAFRFFDIIKPYPAARLERLPNGWGIMLDDVAAGIYANILTHAAILLLAEFFPYLP